MIYHKIYELNKKNMFIEKLLCFVEELDFFNSSQTLDTVYVLNLFINIFSLYFGNNIML